MLCGLSARLGGSKVLDLERPFWVVVGLLVGWSRGLLGMDEGRN